MECRNPKIPKKTFFGALLLFSLSTSFVHPSEVSSPVSELVPVQADNKFQAFFNKITNEALYLGAGTAFGSVSLLARLGWALSLTSPWSSTIGNELLLLSDLCSSAAFHVYAEIFAKSSNSLRFLLSQGFLPSQYSWHLNKSLLSHIPAISKETKQLLHFLENRWLAKHTGFFPSMIDWACPCYGVSVQVHPETTSAYSRDPSKGLSQTYINRMEAWKEYLPQPQNFPLLLTRPANLQEYLPSCISASVDISKTVERLSKISKTVVLDLTDVLAGKDRNEWLQAWEPYQAAFSQLENRDKILCIQRVQQEEIGGIRMLPLAIQSTDTIEHQYRFLLEWIGIFGLTANRIELDRWPISYYSERKSEPSISLESPSREEFVSYLNCFEQSWQSNHPQKTLMVMGALNLLKGLLGCVSDDKWNEIINCPTRSLVTNLSLLKIKEELKLLTEQAKDVLFFDTISHIEQIHANLSSLLEILSPYSSEDFPAIYRNLLVTIPESLKPMTSFAIHASGMTSMMGIFKAVEKNLGKLPRVLYGENTYYECIHAAEVVSNAISTDDATDTDWREVDLILAQFNPVLKRINFQVDEYKVEKIAETLHKTLNVRQGKPLTLALDCTLDYIDSPRVGNLLEEFQTEIEMGILNIICYRSGLKFDLFGMDNYSGAPLYMIHNQDEKWASFDLLLTDPVLLTDRLSINWFCLAYQNAAPQLEMYRKQIFDNTRALLDKVPSRLFNAKGVDYRIVPVRDGADAAFLDIKISGPFHQIRSAALVGGCLYSKCMEGGHPIFYRPSLGFYHPNFTMLFSEECSTIRLTVGLDPAQVNILAETFEKIDALNGPVRQKEQEKRHFLKSVFQNCF